MSAVNVKTEKSCGKDSKKKIAEERVYVRADMFVLVKTNCIHTGYDILYTVYRISYTSYL